jgi:hypothetical protein
MCVCCEVTCGFRTYFSKAFSCLLYCVAAENLECKKKIIGERAENHFAEKLFLSPIFYSVSLLIFCRISAASCSSYSLV